MLKGKTYCLSPGLLTKTALSQAVRKHGGKVITYLSGAVRISTFFEKEILPPTFLTSGFVTLIRFLAV